MSASPKVKPLLKAAPRFERNRARLQRLTDARFFTGWVTGMDVGHVELKLNERADLKRGEELSIEVTGEVQTACFRARVVFADDAGVRLRLTEAIHYRESHESARFKATGIWCTFTDGGRKVVGEVVELSSDGLGLHLSEPVRAGAEITCAITDTFHTVTCPGLLRYCRTDRKVPGRFRAGVHLEIPEAEAQAWERLRRRAVQ